ncbi:MAG: hypothetical protein KC548_06465 [Nanoarchaeota archaeon]|nr:hypothetical protein [Nanoarchaeota archaeon]
MRKNIFLLSIFLGLAFFLASCTDEAFYGDSLGEDNLSVCTRDAKICPDGTAVGRSGPNCEFEACPDSGDPSETCPEIYSPVCGLKEVECIQAPCDSVPVTYVNRCELEHAGAIFMKNGACEDQNETTSCTAVYEPVCGQPPMPECLEGLACIQVMPDPQTYSNACTMNAARATLIHEGEC